MLVTCTAPQKLALAPKIQLFKAHSSGNCSNSHSVLDVLVASAEASCRHPRPNHLCYGLCAAGKAPTFSFTLLNAIPAMKNIASSAADAGAATDAR